MIYFGNHWTSFRRERVTQTHGQALIIGEVLLEHVDIIDVLKLKFDKLKVLIPDPYQIALALKIKPDKTARFSKIKVGTAS